MSELGPIVYFVPVFVILTLADFIVGYRKDGFNPKDSAASITMGLGNLGLGFFAKGIAFGVFAWVYQFRLFTIEMNWLGWILIVLADDFVYYWFHRTSHECRLFWASHVIHHSSEAYNLSTALRQTWTGSFYSFIFWMPLALVGFKPEYILLQQAFSLFYQYFIHTERVDRLGFLEWIMNTPSHHRVHHGSDPKYLDRNHAGIFIIWDRMFGTFQQEEERPKYGIVKNLESFNPFIIAFHEWISIGRDILKGFSPRSFIGYVFGPPGWQPDGKGTTSDVLRKQAGL